jgi:hypothetical protein
MKILITMSLITLLAAIGTYGQVSSTASIEVEVPFQFTLGKAVLPAGTYQFVGENVGTRLSIHDGKTNATANVITQLGGPIQDAILVFDDSAGVRTLSEVWIPGLAGLLMHSIPEGHKHVVLVGFTKGFAKLSGKDAFDRTCSRCHGLNGKGDPDADKFFKMKIPRLNSPSVQAKSDEELKGIIANGLRDMPPVRLDKFGAGHLLPTQSIGEVIKYVRTLK